MFDAKRLHPIAIMVNITKKIKEYISTFIALFFIGNQGGGGKIFLISATCIAVVLIFITSILSWVRYTYRLEDNELRIEYGILVRKKRYIPLERIQSLDLSEGLFQRMFGLVKVQVETAGGSGTDEAEAVLSAITKNEAQIIQDYVTAAKNSAPLSIDSKPKETDVVYKITFGQLMLLSVTSGGVGVVISAVLAFLSQIDDLIPFERLFRGVGQWAAGNLMILLVFILFGLFIAWLIALVGTMLKYANFTVLKTEHDLVISQGLLEKRQITIPLNRIQAIRINENIVRQLIGYGSVVVESAGGSVHNQEGSKVMLLPIISTKLIAAILEPVLQDYQIRTELYPPPTRAVWRYLLRSWYLMIPLVAASVLVFKTWGLLSIILLAISTFWAYLKYKDAGWSGNSSQLNLRYRSILRTTVFMRKEKIQSLEVRQSYFQKKINVATIEAFVKSGIGSAGGKVLDLEETDLERIYQWYSRKKQED